MAKMAVYDKKGFERDAEANQYFRHDYIYKRNMQMRFHLGVGCLILAGFYLLYLLGVQEEDVMNLNFQAELIRFGIFALVVMVGYSFIGTILYTREFIKSQKRVESYFELMRELGGEELVSSHQPEPAAKKSRPRLFARKQKVGPEPEPDEDEEFVPYQKRAGGELYRYLGTTADEENLKER